jgi:hypothetical protein
VGILQFKKNSSPGRPGKDQRKGGVWRLSGAIIPGSRVGFIHAHHYALCGFFRFISLLKDLDYDPLSCTAQDQERLRASCPTALWPMDNIRASPFPWRDYPLLGAKSLPAMVSAYLLKLLALLTPEPMRRTLQYLVIDFP